MNSKQWLALGFIVEALHLLFAFGVLMFGGLWLPGKVVYTAVTVTLMSQIISLGCPLTILSAYCVRKHIPTYQPASLTIYLYRRYGPLVAVPITVVLVALAAVFGLTR